MCLVRELNSTLCAKKVKLGRGNHLLYCLKDKCTAHRWFENHHHCKQCLCMWKPQQPFWKSVGILMELFSSQNATLQLHHCDITVYRAGIKTHSFYVLHFQTLAASSRHGICWIPFFFLFYKNLHCFGHMPFEWSHFCRSVMMHTTSTSSNRRLHDLLSSPLWEMLRMESDMPLRFWNISIKFPH